MSATKSGAKRFLFETLSESRVRAIAAKWGVVITDKRLAATGITKVLAAMRSIELATFLEELQSAELSDACRRAGLATEGSAKQLRARLGEALERASPRELRREATPLEAKLETREARLLDVVDGDTIHVEMDSEEWWVRLRGVDAPEAKPSDKAEEDLDHTGLDPAELFPLGREATEYARKKLEGRKIFLDVQPTPLGPKKYLCHRQHRLLAYVRIDSPSGLELGELLLRDVTVRAWTPCAARAVAVSCAHGKT